MSESLGSHVFNNICVQTIFHEGFPPKARPKEESEYTSGYWQIIIAIPPEQAHLKPGEYAVYLLRPKKASEQNCWQFDGTTVFHLEDGDSLEGIAHKQDSVETPIGTLFGDVIVLLISTEKGGMKMLPIFFEHEKLLDQNSEEQVFILRK